MSMLNMCAKFHGDSPSGEKVKFNLASAIELSKLADFVYNFVLKSYTSEQLQWHIWPTFPLNFLCGFHSRCFSTFSIPWWKVKKMTKSSNQGGGGVLRSFLGSSCDIYAPKDIAQWWSNWLQIKRSSVELEVHPCFSFVHFGDFLACQLNGLPVIRMLKRDIHKA